MREPRDVIQVTLTRRGAPVLILPPDLLRRGRRHQPSYLSFINIRVILLFMVLAGCHLSLGAVFTGKYNRFSTC